MEKEKVSKPFRLHIGIFGRTNVGKSSFLNFISQQEVSITSPYKGTTTDVVNKTMELLPLGPVAFLDTAGLDDKTVLSSSRLKKTLKAFDQSEVAVLIIEPKHWGKYERFVLRQARERNLPFLIVVNKIDLEPLGEQLRKRLSREKIEFIEVSSIDYQNRDFYINCFKNALAKVCPPDYYAEPPLVSDLIPTSGLVVLVVPIDLQAPRGRLILPQVQTLREILDSDAACLVVKEREYSYLLKSLGRKPDLVICDSQVVLKMIADTPPEVKCTTFSIIFARFKADLLTAVKSVLMIENLKPKDKVLIAEACSHHPIEDDIGRVKIPRWLRQYTGFDLEIDISAGQDFAEDLSRYKLVVHCGGCMLRRRQMLLRAEKARKKNVALTNYGVTIAFLQGVLSRVLSPFPAVREIFERERRKTRRKYVVV